MFFRYFGRQPRASQLGHEVTDHKRIDVFEQDSTEERIE
jgi:hypothetical protein